jgi:hypothetical protein
MAFKPFILAAASALTFATPAFAGEIADNRYRIEAEATRKAVMRYEIAYLALSAADLVITVRCLERNECEEMNPVWGKHPSTQKLVIGKIAGGVIHFAAIRYIADRNPKLALRLAQISVAVQGGVVGFNLTSEF